MEIVLAEHDTTDGMYLLTALSNMACASNDSAFIKFVTERILLSSFISDSTKDAFYKVGRELLAAICDLHPEIMSYVLARVDLNIGAVSSVRFEFWGCGFGKIY